MAGARNIDDQVRKAIMAVLRDPEATPSAVQTAAMKLMVANELESPGCYGASGLPAAVAGYARVVEAEMEQKGGDGGLKELIEFMAEPPEGGT